MLDSKAGACGCEGVFSTSSGPRQVGRWPLRSREMLARWRAANDPSPGPVCSRPAPKGEPCCDACARGDACEGETCNAKPAGGPSQQAAYDACVEMGGSDCGRLLGGSGGGESDTDPDTRMTRATWERLSPTERAEYLRTIARTETERQQLLANTLTGTFDRLVDYLRTRRDIEIARINANRDVEIARIREGREVERDILRDEAPPAPPPAANTAMPSWVWPVVLLGGAYALTRK